MFTSLQPIAPPQPRPAPRPQRAPTPPTPPSRPALRRAMTLLEILVVVVIIVILLGIGAAVGKLMVGTGEAKLTESAMLRLMTINDKYAELTGGPVTLTPDIDDVQFNVGGSSSTMDDNVLDFDADSNPEKFMLRSIEQFVYVTFPYDATSQRLSTASELGQLYASMVSDKYPLLVDDADTRVFDPTGSLVNNGSITDKNEMLEVRDGWGNKIVYKYDPNDASDSTDDFDADDFLPIRRQPYFASPGPDGKFGDVTAVNTSEAFKATQDNVYSFNLGGAIQ